MQPIRNKVLIVDDEDAVVLALLRTLYGDNEQYDVLLAKTGEIAQQILRENNIDLMVTDVRMPGMSGLDLLCWAAQESPNTRVIVISSFDIEGAQQRAHDLGCLRVVQKPLDLPRTRETIRDALSYQSSLAGTIAELSPADVIQMLCLGGKTTALRVVNGTDSGLIYISDGGIVHAVWNDDALVGEEAVYQILLATQGMFTLLPYPDSNRRTIEGGWQHLLLEGMRRKDEAAMSLSAPGRQALVAALSDPRPAASEESSGVGDPWLPPADPHEVAALIDQGFDAMRANDLGRARRRWEAAMALDPQNRMVELNLRKLAKLDTPSEG